MENPEFVLDGSDILARQECVAVRLNGAAVENCVRIWPGDPGRVERIVPGSAKPVQGSPGRESWATEELSGKAELLVAGTSVYSYEEFTQAVLRALGLGADE